MSPIFLHLFPVLSIVFLVALSIEQFSHIPSRYLSTKCLSIFFGLLSSDFFFFFYAITLLKVFYQFFRFSLFSQVSPSTVHPFYYIKYLSFPYTFLLFMIFLTSHSSSSSITTSCGIFFLCSSTCDLYLHTLLMLTTGCILTILGNSNSIALLKIIAFTL